MATRKYKFKHIAQSASTHVGDLGELILDTATNTLKVSDGSTAGGVSLNTDGSTDLSYEAKSADFTAVKGKRYLVDISNNQVNVTLPATPSAGDAVQFVSGGANNFGNPNNIVFLRNGSTIEGSASNKTLSSNDEVLLVYSGTTWRERVN